MSRRLGQHFLADRRALERIANALELTGSELVLEVGPGRGALTAVLAPLAGKLAAIELDTSLAAMLRKTYEGNDRVEIVEADVLSVDFPALVASAGFERARVAGNLPYYITSPILTKLFESAHLFDRIVALVQLEVAHRLTATPGSRDYGFLSVTTQYFSRPKLLFRVPRGAFRPPPKVESAAVLFEISPRAKELGIENDRQFLDFAGRCFRHKRKTLRNNLPGVPLEKLNLPPAVRAEELSVAKLAEIFRHVR